MPCTLWVRHCLYPSRYLYPHEEDETTVYYTMNGTEMKQERTNRKYPIKQLLTENEKKETIYVPYQAPTRTFTRADQYGTTSHKTEPGRVFPSSTAYPRAVPKQMTRSTLRQLREEEYGARHQPSDAQYVHNFVHDPELTRRIKTSSRFDDTVGTQPWTMREEFEKRPWQYLGTASVGVKQKGMMYYTEQDVKDSRFADPDSDRDDDGDTRSRE